jgi:hypothetical protein
VIAALAVFAERRIEDPPALVIDQRPTSTLAVCPGPAIYRMDVHSINTYMWLHG